MIKMIALELLIIVCIIGCKKNQLEDYQKVIVDSNVEINSFRRLLVIPNEGCSGCISNATQFALNDLTIEDSTLVIFTDVKDYKFFNLKICHSPDDYGFVKIDTVNVFSATSVKSIYPRVWELSKGRVVDVYNF